VGWRVPGDTWPGGAHRPRAATAAGHSAVVLIPPSGGSSSSFAGLRSGLRMLVEGGERL